MSYVQVRKRCAVFGVKVRNIGSAKEKLRKLRDLVVAEMDARFQDRGILDKFVWLDVSTWPRADLMSDVEDIWQHWCTKLTELGCTWRGVQEDLKNTLVVWQATAKPIGDSMLF